MSKLMQCLGGLWALIGASQILLSAAKGTFSDTAMGFLILANVLLYIMPGLVLYAIGKKLSA